MRKRNIRIQFWLNKKEAEVLHKRVKRSGLSREAFLRHLVSGYIPKDARPAEIANAIRTIAAGGNYLPEPIRRIYEARKSAKGLTEREVAILRYIAKGLSYHEIGEQYNISVNTVKIHVRHIFEKLDVSDRTEAVTLAIARGIIEG